MEITRGAYCDSRNFFFFFFGFGQMSMWKINLVVFQSPKVIRYISLIFKKHYCEQPSPSLGFTWVLLRVKNNFAKYYQIKKSKLFTCLLRLNEDMTKRNTISLILCNFVQFCCLFFFFIHIKKNF